MPIGNDHVWLEDSAGEGPVVLLLHPGIGDSRAWDPIWDALTPTCRVIRYDVRAYGRSPHATEAYTTAGDLRAVLDHLGLDAAHLVGCSMGGAAAMELAVTDPDRVASLVLLCPGIGGYDWPDEPELDAEYERLEADNDVDGLVAFSLREWTPVGHEPIVVDLARSAAEAVANEAEFGQRGVPAYDRLGELAIPVILMVGDRDRAPLIEANHAVAARIPGCRLVTMPGVDHLPMLREPEWVTRTILEQVHA